MPRIATIRVHSSDSQPPVGIKRQVYSQPLTGCDLVIGGNGSGKTSRLLGIVAALEGLASVPTDPRRPHLGDLPAHTAVSLDLDTGETLTRDLSLSRGKAVDEANQAARDVVGVPPTAWDLSDFAQGTDGDRGKVLDAVARAGGAIQSWDRTTAITHVRGLMVAAEANPVALDEAAQTLPSAADGATWLRSALTWAEARQTERNAAQREAMAQVPAQIDCPADVGGDASADSARADTLRRERATLQAIDTTAAARHDDEGARLQAEVERIKASGLRLREPTQPVDPSYQRRVDEAKSAKAPDLAPLNEAMQKADVEVKAAKKALDTALVVEEDASKAKERASQATATAIANLATLQSLSKSDAPCVHCGEADPLGFAPRIAAARDAVRAAESASVELVAQFGAARKATESARKAHADASAAVTVAHVARFNAGGEAESNAAILTRAEADLDRATKQRAATEAKREADLLAMRAQYQAAAQAHEAWTARVRPPSAEVDQERIDAIGAELADIEARQEKRRARTAWQDAAAKAGARALSAKALWDSTRALVVAVRQARDDLAAAAYSPIEAAARDLLAEATDLVVPYFASPSDYGASIPGRGRVPFAGLSGAQRLVTAASLVYALAVVARNRVRVVLLDEIDVITEDYRLPLLRALAAARAAGKVDTVLLTMATMPGQDLSAYHAIPGLTLHTVEASAATEPTPDAQAKAAPINSDEIPF